MPTVVLFSVAPLLLEALLKLLLPKRDDIVAPVALPPNADADTNGCVAGVWKEDAVEGVTADEDSPPNDGPEVDTGPVGFDDVITLLLIAPNVGVTEAGVDGFPENFRNFEINNLFKLLSNFRVPRYRVNHFRDARRTTSILLLFFNLHTQKKATLFETILTLK